MKQSPRLTIIILNFNGLNDTRACLRSVLKTDYPQFHVLVVDNGSAADEAAILKKEYSSQRVSFLRFNKNLGYSGGNNRAAAKVSSKYIVFLNNDTTVDPSWLKPLVNAMEADTTVAACQPKIVLMGNPKMFDYAGACGGFIDQYGYPFTRGRIFFTSEEDTKQYDANTDIFWSSGAAMMVRRSAFLKVGKFDERFFLYMEEIDLCWRFLDAHLKIRAIPASVVLHKVAGTARKSLFKKRYFEHRNNLLLLAKNYTRSELLILFPRRFLFEVITFGYYLFRFDMRGLFALLYAHLHFWRLFFSIRHTRRIARQGLRAHQDIVLNKSIVIAYFLKQKKTFQTAMSAGIVNASLANFNQKSRKRAIEYRSTVKPTRVK